VAQIQTDTQFIVISHFIIDLCELFKAASDFRAFSGHCFQCDITGAGVQHFIQSLSDSVNTGFCTGADMGAGMQDQYLAAHRLCAFDLQSQKFYGKFIGLCIDRIGQIDNIGRVYDKFLNPVRFHIFPRRLDLQGGNILSFCILGRSGIDHKSVCTIRDGFLSGSEQHFFAVHADMGTDLDHSDDFLSGFLLLIGAISLCDQFTIFSFGMYRKF